MAKAVTDLGWGSRDLKTPQHVYSFFTESCREHMPCYVEVLHLRIAVETGFTNIRGHCVTDCCARYGDLCGGCASLCMSDVSSSEKLIYSIICICLVLIGGVMSGLTLGLMSLDVVDLEVSPASSSECCCLLLLHSTICKLHVYFTRCCCKHYIPFCIPLTTMLQVLVRSGTPSEKKYAKRIQPVRSYGAILFCLFLAALQLLQGHS